MDKVGWIGGLRAGFGRVSTAIVDHQAAFEPDNRSRTAGEFLIVCDEDKCGAGLGVEMEEKFDDEMARLAIEIAGRFVREEDLGAIDEGARDRHTLLFATRELRRVVMQPFTQPYALEQLNRLLERMIESAEFHGHHHVFNRGDRWDELEVLKDEPAHAATQLGAAIFVQGREVRACKRNAAGSRDIESCTKAKQRRLAAAGRTENGAGVAAREGEGDVAQNGQIMSVTIFPVRRRGIAFRQPVNFEDQTVRHGMTND